MDGRGQAEERIGSGSSAENNWRARQVAIHVLSTKYPQAAIAVAGSNGSAAGAARWR